MNWKKEADRLREKKPGHILFLCVANSARSQMAEGIARHLAPASLAVSSAGSKPSFVHPLAIEVLSEIGIDIRSQKSKRLDAVDSGKVDAVITLCEEEVCPVFLNPAEKIHWGLPDPAGEGNDAKKLDTFRRVRNELVLRLKYLFRDWT